MVVHASPPPAISPDHASLLSEQQALRWARRCALVGLASCVPLYLALPVSPVLPVIEVPGYALAACWLAWRLRVLAQRQRSVRAPRHFSIQPHAVPHRGAGERWQRAWVPFTMVGLRDAHGRISRWHKHLRADAATRAVLSAQEAWLRQHHPQRLALVDAWWQERHVGPWLASQVARDAAQPAAPMAHLEAGDRASAQRAVAVERLCGICLAGQPELWPQRLGFGDAEVAAYAALAGSLRALETTPASASLPTTPFPRPDAAVATAFFLGRGFRWDGRHAQAVEELRAAAGQEAGPVPEQGDPRLYGIGAQLAHDVFLEEAQFNQMVGIFGTTGVGKTRLAESLLVQVIHSGLPLVIIDPKGDQLLTNRVLEECRAQGRGHQFQYFCLAAPPQERTWSYLSRYNPCASYTDPAELAARISSVLPHTRDPFWTNVAKAMVETCVTLCHWLNWYLRLLGGGEASALAPRDEATVPLLVLALQWARHHPGASPAEADAACRGIRASLLDPAWQARSPAEREVVALLRTRSLAGNAMHSALEWLPSIRQVADYEVDQTVAFLGWVLKIVFQHVYLGSARFAAPDAPLVLAAAEIVARPGHDEASLWTLYLQAGPHPLECRLSKQSPGRAEERRLRDFFDYFVPPGATDEVALGRCFAQLRRALAAHASDAAKDRQKFLEYATTLQSAIRPFLGERARIMCAPVSDLDWDEVVAQRQIVYCALGSMIDEHGANACARLLIQDLAAWFGRRYQYRPGNPQPFYLFADEVSSFINEPFIQLLNKCRGVGLRAILAGQTRADLAKQLGREGSQQALGNLNTLIQLRSPLEEDARDFSGRTGEVTITRDSRSLSVSPGASLLGGVTGDFTAQHATSSSQVTVKRVPPDAVLQLPRGQAFVQTQGHVYLISTGLFAPPTTDLCLEIGMHPGVMREPVGPLADGSATAAHGAPVPGAPAPRSAAPPSLATAADMDAALPDGAPDIDCLEPR